MKTIAEFCKEKRFSQSFYFKMRKQGLGPREMRINSAVRITEQAENEWEREREVKSQRTEAIASKPSSPEMEAA